MAVQGILAKMEDDYAAVATKWLAEDVDDSPSTSIDSLRDDLRTVRTMDVHSADSQPQPQPISFASDEPIVVPAELSTSADESISAAPSSPAAAGQRSSAGASELGWTAEELSQALSAGDVLHETMQYKEAFER